ncbi:unnamed protein product, partial [Mesorhabditis spiculigera]
MRRARVAARPNISAAPKQKPKPSAEHCNSEKQLLETKCPPIGADETRNEAHVVNVQKKDVTSPVMLKILENTCETVEAPAISPRKVAFVSQVKGEGGRLSSFAMMSPRRNRMNSVSSLCDGPSTRKKFRKFTGEEMLDTKHMRMSDLVAWNPKNEQKLERKITEEALAREIIPKEEKKLPMAPQVSIGPDGNLVLDETSLLIRETEQRDVWESVDEDRLHRHTTSMSFRARNWKKGAAWSDKETDLFFEILRHTGPDFGLMHEFFPTRARNELKSKYNREEKTNWARVDQALSLPATLDNKLYQHAEQVINEIKQEEDDKRIRKRKINMEEARIRNREPHWDESHLDLVAEAVKIIDSLEQQPDYFELINEGRKAAKHHQIAMETKNAVQVLEKASEAKKPPALIGYGPTDQAVSNVCEAVMIQTKKVFDKAAVEKVYKAVRADHHGFGSRSEQPAAAAESSCLTELPSSSVTDVPAAVELVVEEPPLQRPIAIRPMLDPASLIALPPISDMLPPISHFQDSGDTSSASAFTTLQAAAAPLHLSEEGPSAFSAPSQADKAGTTTTYLVFEERPMPVMTPSTTAETTPTEVAAALSGTNSTSTSFDSEELMSMGNFTGKSSTFKRAAVSKKISSRDRLWSSRFPLTATKIAHGPEARAAVVESDIRCGSNVEQAELSAKDTLPQSSGQPAEVSGESKSSISPVRRPTKRSLLKTASPLVEASATISSPPDNPDVPEPEPSSLLKEELLVSEVPVPKKVEIQDVGGLKLAVQPVAVKNLGKVLIRRPARKAFVAPVAKCAEIAVPATECQEAPLEPAPHTLTRRNARNRK